MSMEDKNGQARKEYLDSLKARLSADQVEFAEFRLDKAILHAKKLQENNRVIATED